MKDSKTVLDIRESKTVLINDNDTIISHDPVYGEIREGEIVDGYVVGSLLSYSGGESDIRLCKKNNTLYVIKIYRYNNISFQKHKVIKEINSPFIMPILSFGFHNNRPYEIMPYMVNGTLSDFLKSGKKIDNNFIKKIFIPQMNEALHTINTYGVVHNDIKPENIYISNDKKNIILGDFGISKILDGRTSVTNINGARSRHYSAPESEKYSSPEADYYSFGMTLLDVALGDFYWSGLSGIDAEKDRTRHGIVVPKKVDSNISELIYELTRFAPKERATYETVSLWINDNTYFSKKNPQVNNQRYDFNYTYVVKINGERKIVNSIIELSKLFSTEWEIGVKHFANNLISESVKSLDQALYIELNDIFNEYYITNKNPNTGLFLTLREINPDIDFIFKGINYKNFTGFIGEQQKIYPKYDLDIMNINVLCSVLSNEKYDTETIDFIKMLYKKCLSIDYFNDAILNLFNEENMFYANGKCYNDVEQFISNINKKRDILDYLKQGEELFVEIISYSNKNNNAFIAKSQKIVSYLYSNLSKFEQDFNMKAKSKEKLESPKEIFGLYLNDAENGNSKAQFNVGTCYEMGYGVRKNYQKAIEWYTLAAKQNYSEAELKLGEIYSIGGKYKVKRNEIKAFEYFKLAESHGNQEAKRIVAIAHIRGIKGYLRRTAKNINKGIENLSELARNGDAIAARFLGAFYWLYEKEEYRDSIKSFEWYLIAAELGDAEAQYQIGLWYEKGYRRKKNIEKAIKWYKKSIEQGYHKAAVCLGKFYLESKETENAIRYFEIALELIPAEYENHFTELLTLGFIYDKGLGIKKDHEKARYYYSEAAKISTPYCFDSDLQALKEKFK